MREVLKDRERALEYEFFHRVDERLLRELREKIELEEQEKALADATGIVEEAVLAELIDVKVTPENDLCPFPFPAGVDCLGGWQHRTRRS